MNDALVVRRAETERELTDQVHRARRSERSLGVEQVAQGAPAHELLHEEARAVVEGAHVARGRDVRVRDVRAGHGLALEAMHEIRKRLSVRVQHLDRDLFAL